MKKFLASLVVMICIAPNCFAQTTTSTTTSKNLRPVAIGVSFSLNDFATADRIRTTTLSSVIRNKERAKFNEMPVGLALSYFKGLTNNIDFAGTLSGVFVDLALEDRTTSGDAFLVQADASLNLKLLNENYFMTPYATIGVGASKYKKQFGAFIPTGLGLKFNFFNEAALFINSQYRIPVTSDTYNYNFFHSIGIAGNIGK